MTPWKYSADGKSASRTIDNGFTESRLISAIPAAELAIALPADMPTLVEAKLAQVSKINSSCQQALQAIVSAYPALEVATWPNQYSEAIAFTANSTAPTPTLSAIATASGQTVAALAAYILTKATAYTAASGALVGKRQMLTAQINAATTVAQVQGIVW